MFYDYTAVRAQARELLEQNTKQHTKMPSKTDTKLLATTSNLIGNSSDVNSEQAQARTHTFLFPTEQETLAT